MILNKLPCQSTDYYLVMLTLRFNLGFTNVHAIHFLLPRRVKGILVSFVITNRIFILNHGNDFQNNILIPYPILS